MIVSVRFRSLSAPIDLKHSTPQRVLDDMDEQYVCVQVHVRGPVRQHVTINVRRMERKGGMGKFSGNEAAGGEAR